MMKETFDFTPLTPLKGRTNQKFLFTLFILPNYPIILCKGLSIHQCCSTHRDVSHCPYN
jgi:hypothetical protein